MKYISVIIFLTNFCLIAQAESISKESVEPLNSEDVALMAEQSQKDAEVLEKLYRQEMVEAKKLSVEQVSLQTKLDKLLINKLHRDSFSSNGQNSQESFSQDLLKSRDAVVQFITKERDPELLGQISRVFGLLINNYLKLSGRFMVVEFNSSFAGKSSDQLLEVYNDRRPIFESRERWSLKIPFEIYSYVYSGINHRPDDVDIVVSNIGDSKSTMVSIVQNKLFVFARMMEALTSQPPQRSYFPYIKCQLGVITLAKNARALQILAVEDERKPWIEDNFCLGLKAEQIYSVGMKKVNTALMSGPLARKSTRSGERVRSLLISTMPDNLSYMEKKNQVLYMGSKRAYAFGINESREALFHDALDPTLIFPTKYVDVMESDSVAEANLTDSAKQELSRYREGDLKHGLEEKFVSRTEFKDFISDFDRSSDQLERSYPNIFGSFRSELFQTVFEKVIEKLPVFKEKLSKLMKDREKWNRILQRGEYFYFRRWLDPVINDSSFPMEFLLDGEESESHRQVLKMQFEVVKQFALSDFLMAILNHTGDKNNTLFANLNSEEKELAYSERVLTARFALYQILSPVISSSVEVSMRQGRLRSWLGTWRDRLKSSYSQAGERDAREYGEKLVVAANAAYNYKDATRLGDTDLPTDTYVIYQVLKLLSTKIDGEGFSVSNRAHDWAKDYIFNPEKKAKDSQLTGTDSEVEKIDKVMQRIIKSCPGLTEEKIESRLSSEDKGWLSGFFGIVDKWSAERIQCAQSMDRPDYLFLNSLKYILGSTDENGNRRFPAVMSRVRKLIPDEKQFRAFVLLYRRTKQRIELSKFRLLDMQLPIDQVRWKELASPQDNGSGIESDKVLVKEEYSGTAPLYDLIGKSATYGSEDVQFISQAVYLTVSNIHKQLKKISNAKKIEDLSLFIVESSVVNKILGSDNREEVLKHIGLSPSQLNQELESANQANNLVLLAYHEKQQKKMFVNKKVEGEDIQTVLTAYNAPILSQQDLAALALIIDPIAGQFQNENDIVNSVYGANPKGTYQEDHTLFISLLDVALMRAFLPRSLGKTFVDRFVDANSWAAKGYIKLFIPVFAAEAFYNAGVDGELEEKNMSRRVEMTYSEVDNLEHSLLRLSDFERYRIQTENLLHEYDTALYWVGGLVAFSAVTYGVNRAYRATLQKKKYGLRESRFAHMVQTGESFEEEALRLAKRSQKIGNKNRVYFDDLGLDVGTWNPKILMKTYLALKDSRSLTNLERHRVKIAYERLMLINSKEFQVASDYTLFGKLKSKVYFKDYSKANYKLIQIEANRIRQAGGGR